MYCETIINVHLTELMLLLLVNIEQNRGANTVPGKSYSRLHSHNTKTVVGIFSFELVKRYCSTVYMYNCDPLGLPVFALYCPQPGLRNCFVHAAESL